MKKKAGETFKKFFNQALITAMSKLVLFIAQTLDGYIATKDGDIDWLSNHPNPDQLDYGYNAFIDNVDTIVMGRVSYEKILSFGIDWPYGAKKTFIVTKSKTYQTSTENTYIINTISQESLAEIKKQSKQNIWLLGGGEVIKSFLGIHAVDEMLITLVPLLLGEGLRLFPEGNYTEHFDFLKAESFSNGLLNLSYCKK